METRLTSRCYLFGDRIVESDWRLFCTLVRFDVVYHIHFKCTTHDAINPTHLVPIGPALDLTLPHGREKLATK